MKEIQAIIKAYEQHKHETLALATVIEVSGSTYRRAGAKMLMTKNGYRVGSISGGCLEEDVFEQAQAVMASGKSTVIQYDTTSPDDIVWGLGLGCHGKVRVFIEKLTSDQFNPVSFIAETWRQRQPGVIATIVNSDTEIGKHLLLQQDSKVISESNFIAERILEDAKLAFNHKSLLKLYQLPKGEAEVFIEVIQPPVPLLIFGAGDDAVPVVEFAKALGWQVTVFDSRPAYAKREVFAKADAVIIAHPEQIERIALDSHTVAVVMTHNYLHDQEILQTLLPSAVSYIGILGPKSRTQQILKELQEAGIYPTNEQLQRLYSPVGLDIGADTPEAIALSIIAEIQAVLAAHCGGFLKNRPGPIHPVNPQMISQAAI